MCVCVCVQRLLGLRHASMPAQGRQVQRRAVHPACKDGDVSRQSGARMLHCCPYRESNTQIEEGGKNPGIRLSLADLLFRLETFTQGCYLSPFSRTNVRLTFVLAS